MFIYFSIRADHPATGAATLLTRMGHSLQRNRVDYERALPRARTRAPAGCYRDDCHQRSRGFAADVRAVVGLAYRCRSKFRRQLLARLVLQSLGETHRSGNFFSSELESDSPSLPLMLAGRLHAHARSFDRPQKLSGMIWRSPLWMPLACEVVAVQFGYIGLLGAINIPFYEDMAHRIHWWQ
jgi:hypothetical protein